MMAIDAPGDPHATAGLHRGVRRVANQIDQHLLDLIAIGADRALRSWDRHDPESRLQTDDPPDDRRQIDGAQPRLRQTCEPRVSLHEPAQGIGAPRDHGQPLSQVILPIGQPGFPLERRFKTPRDRTNGCQ